MSTGKPSTLLRVWVPPSGGLAFGLNLADGESPPRESLDLQVKLIEKIQFAIHRAGGLEKAKELVGHPAVQEARSVSEAAGNLVETPEVQQALSEVDYGWDNPESAVEHVNPDDLDPEDSELLDLVVRPNLLDLLEALGVP